MKYAFFTIDFHGIPLAYHLQQEGHEVWVGMVNSWERIKVKHEETPEKKQRRLSLYDGLLKRKVDADQLLQKLLVVPMKERAAWRVICDFNYLWMYADTLKKAGYHGMLPSQKDELLEKDRRKAKKLVEEKYAMLTVGEYKEFKRVEEGKKFLSENQDTNYVLKGFNEQCRTIVPKSDEPKINHAILLAALEEYKQAYEKEGYLLEEKIHDLLEFTPEAVTYSGKVVSVSLNIEHKLIGSRNGQQVGCSLDLIAWQDIDGILYEYFLKPIEDLMLRSNELTVWDASVLYSPSRKKFFFGEFCQNRFGFNCVFSEMSTFGSTSAYFDRAFNQEPLFQQGTKQFGVSVRVFNLRSDEVRSGGKASGELIIADLSDPNIWAWDVLKAKGGIHCVGFDKNTLIVTGSADTVDESINDLYKNLDKVTFDSGFCLQKHDWYDKKFPQNILHRYEVLSQLDMPLEDQPEVPSGDNSEEGEQPEQSVDKAA